MWTGLGRLLEERIVGISMDGSAGPGDCIPVLKQGFLCPVKNSGGRHS